MKIDFPKELAIVTGAGTGIGAAVAERLAGQGAVLCIGRTLSKLESLAEKVGPSLMPYALDVADRASLDRLAGDLKSSGTSVTALINNAGIMIEDDIDRIDIAAVRLQFEVNALGPLGVAPYEEGALDVHVSQLPSVTMRSTSTSLGVTSTVAALGGFSLARGMNLAAAGADMSSIGMGPLAGPAHPLASATAHELPPHPIMPQLSSALTGGGQLQPHQTATVVAVGPYAHAYAQQQAVPLQPLPSASLMTLGSGKVHGGNFFEHERVGQPSPKQQQPPPPQQQRAPRSVIRGPTTVAPLSSSASSWTPSHMGTWNPDAVASLIANTAPPSAAEAAALRAQPLGSALTASSTRARAPWLPSALKPPLADRART